jgi:hypothetical protein
MTLASGPFPIESSLCFALVSWGSARKGHVNPMNKTLPMTLMAIALLAMAVTPSASACQYIGPADDQVNYLTCQNPAPSFVLQEAGEVVAFVVDFVTGIPLPP